jgi:hypothetical protein
VSRAILLCALVACAAPDVSPPTVPRIPIDAAAPIRNDARVPDPIELDAATESGDAGVLDAAVAAPEVWLKGSTHVHARPSGDSSTPIPEVIQWYEDHRYDFVVLTDHNQISELSRDATPTVGQVAVRVPATGLIVLAGIELTHNPSNCIPPGDKSGKCRIHVNLLGVTARTTGKLDWANRKTRERLAKYDAALAQQKALGGIAQINHPNWFWGMSGDLLAELARRGFTLVEIANAAFAKWNKGDKDHSDMDTVWDAALVQGVTLWGVASDDAHDYEGRGKQKYPAGGGWVVVKAVRDPHAILAALAAGHFYSSNGVVLEHAEVDGDALVVEVAAAERGTYTIDFIENGKRAQRVIGKAARRPLPATGYVRALVTRDDGKRAWVQPARR